MTINAFNNNRLSLLTLSSDLCQKMCNKIKLDQDWNNDLYRLYVLNSYTQIYLEYDPTRAAGENFFSVDDMLFIQEKINILFNLDFTLDFILVV